MKIYFFSFLFLLFGLVNASAQGRECEQWLDEGLKAEANGNYYLALELWVDSRSDLNEPCPSVSFEYIRLVTEQKLKNYYPMAHSMYMWGLTTENLADHHEVIKAEVARLQPIMTTETFDRLQNLAEDNNPALLEKIILFWDDSRLTSASSFNERLLEHWERIAYARKHFEKDNQLPYGTDDRGAFYVRFGEPDHKAETDMTIKHGDIIRILSMNELREFNAYFPRFMTEAGSLFSYNPFVEVWRYDKNSDFISEFVLLFNRNGDGTYRYLRTIDDLIKNHSFSRYKAPIALTPGILIQAILYDKLKFTANVFADRASRLNFEINSIKGEQEQINITRAGLTFKIQNQTKAVYEIGNAPSKTSTHLKQIPEMQIEFFQYRMIDEDEKPLFITFIESRPMEALILDVTTNQNVMTESEMYNADSLTESDVNNLQILQNYSLNHTIELRNENREMISHTKHTPVLEADFENIDRISQSVFKIPYLEDDLDVTLYAELKNHRADTKPFFETSFSNNLRGLSRKQLSQKEPLILLPGKLSASDLIVGYQKNESPDQETLFPFVVSNRGEIPLGAPLVVHFELYQLGLNEIGHSQFEVEYSLSKRNIMNLFKQTEGGISTTVFFEQDKDRFSDVIEIQTDDLPIGSYDFEMQFRDLISNQTISRRTRLHFIENGTD